MACRILGSMGVTLSMEWVLSSPQDHCTVPAPKTNAPLGARYKVR